MADITTPATLGYPGQEVNFRMNPSSVRWGFKVNTHVDETLGGRVIQVLGATVTDLLIVGLYGQEQGGRTSQELAEDFFNEMRNLQSRQSRDVTRTGLLQEPMNFRLPIKDWNFKVYLKNIADPDGGSVTMRSGKFLHGYQLTLKVEKDLSDTGRIVGTGSSDLVRAQDAAVRRYIDRFSDGMGWKHSDDYNGRVTIKPGDFAPTPTGLPLTTTTPNGAPNTIGAGANGVFNTNSSRSNQ